MKLSFNPDIGSNLRIRFTHHFIGCGVPHSNPSSMKNCLVSSPRCLIWDTSHLTTKEKAIDAKGQPCITPVEQVTLSPPCVISIVSCSYNHQNTFAASGTNAITRSSINERSTKLYAFSKSTLFGKVPRRMDTYFVSSSL